MKHFVFPLFVALLITACKNSNNNAAATTGEETAQPAQPDLTVTPEQLKNAETKATATLQTMQEFINELNAEASGNVPEAKKEELNSIRSQLSGVFEKQRMMTDGIVAASKASAGGSGGNSDLGAGVPPPGVLKDYVESINNYDQYLGELKAQYEAWKKK